MKLRLRNRVPGLCIACLSLILVAFAVQAVPGIAQDEVTSARKEAGGEQPNGPLGKILSADVDDYEVGPDDVLEVDVFDVKELSGEYRVSPNGSISLPLLSQPIDAAGLTLSQLSERISQHLRRDKLITYPRVTVSVKESRRHSVAITGAVKRPQLYPVFAQTTLLDLLSQAEGLTDDAGSAAVISRGAIALRRLGLNIRGENGQNGTIPPSVTVDLKQLLEAGNSGSNSVLYPGDRVTIPHAGLFYVLGAVSKPGEYNLRDAQETMSVLMALAAAGGIAPSAKSQKALLIRKNVRSPGGREEIPVNLKEIISGRAPDHQMTAGDILFIPESSGKKAGRAVLSSIGAITTTSASGIIVYRR